MRPDRTGRLVFMLGAFAAAFAGSTAWAAPPEWTLIGPVAEPQANSVQFDAVRGPSNRIHLVTGRYYQLGQDGTALVNEDEGDDWQCTLCFPPAVAVADDGRVHIITRHGGDWDTGHDIRYRSRSPSGNWDTNYVFGTPVERNYIVSIACAADHVYMTYSEKLAQPAHGDVHLWEAGLGSATFLGTLSDITRSDDHTRMRGNSGRIYLVTGLPNDTGNGGAYFLNALAGDGFFGAFDASAQFFNSGVDVERKGLPDIYVDGTGAVQFTYGAQETVYYNRFTSDGQVVGGDVTLATGLGTYNTSIGMSAVAASDDGRIVVAALLSPPGIAVSGQAANSALLTTYSFDGGLSWSTPAELGVFTDGGTGRHLPRLVAIGNTFYLFYEDHTERGVSLAMTTVDPDHDGDGFTASEDCDDNNDQVYPGATEQCNGHDDNCDNRIDEGCLGDGGVDGEADGSEESDAGRTDSGTSNPAVTHGCNCRSGGDLNGLVLLLFTLIALAPLFLRRARGATVDGVRRR